MPRSGEPSCQSMFLGHILDDFLANLGQNIWGFSGRFFVMSHCVSHHFQFNIIFAFKVLHSSDYVFVTLTSSRAKTSGSVEKVFSSDFLLLTSQYSELINKFSFWSGIYGLNRILSIQTLEFTIACFGFYFLFEMVSVNAIVLEILKCSTYLRVKWKKFRILETFLRMIPRFLSYASNLLYNLVFFQTSYFFLCLGGSHCSYE